ncbi:hypothetical protein KSX_57820 [Ktedonospora formicarum]|uniref:DNA polymerase III beta sliding clamp C-terminal domain-containing protein n=1 Tax=Ktedonospora formicarum TaxID=2778364 RepID=A0A8J3IAB5_9CHLR|nr:hypothetical protein KSX_57820 [Ktedonospora formicarum]
MTLRGQETQEGEPNTVTLQATAEELGTNVSVIPATISGDDQHEICLNTRYLADVLAVLDMPEMALEVVSPLRPIEITPALASTQYHYVMMPLSTRASDTAQSTSRLQRAQVPEEHGSAALT